MYLLLKTLITPFSLCMLISLVGLIFLLSTKEQKRGKIIITIGFSFLFLFSLPLLPNLLLGHLEQRYTAFKIDEQKDKLSDVDYIVVLAGGHVLDPKLPITSQFSYSGLVRLIEGIRLYRKISGAKLILSGGVGIDPITDAELMADLSINLGIPKANIILESESLNTYDEARFLKPIVKNKRFLLVTSASHMPRAMALFKKQGMKPIAAPTDYWIKKNQYYFYSFLPQADNLRKNELILYEYLGLIKEKLLGHI